MTFGKLVDKAKEKSKEATSSIKETTQNIAYISKEKMQAGVNKTIDETQALIVILQKCGYIVGDLAMTLSVPPEIEITLQDAGGGQSKLSKLMEKEGDTFSKFQTAILRGMLKTYDLLKTTEKHGYTFGEFDVAVTFPPRVTVHLLPDEKKEKPAPKTAKGKKASKKKTAKKKTTKKKTTKKK